MTGAFEAASSFTTGESAARVDADRCRHKKCRCRDSQSLQLVHVLMGWIRVIRCNPTDSRPPGGILSCRSQLGKFVLGSNSGFAVSGFSSETEFHCNYLLSGIKNLSVEDVIPSTPPVPS